MVDQQEEAIVLMKGKRTKRPRLLSSLTLGMSSEEESGPRGAENYSDESMERVESTVDTTEDEDMAHCLILLAQGSKSSRSTQLLVPTKPTTTTTNKGNDSGNSYECKTCNKSFASFQALGGHRASHKKPKLGIGFEYYQTKKSSIYSLISEHNQAHHQLYDHQYNKDEIALSLHIANTSCTSSNNNNSSRNNNNNKAKVHECSICGAEFSSGQALGGHMRRHRPIGGATSISTIPTSSQSVHVMASSSSNNPSRDNKEIKTHNFLSLDLNLPAPEDDHHQHQHQQQERDNSKFVFPLNGKTLAFSASSLVDCHY